MKTFRENVKEIKRWTLLSKAGVALMAVTYLPLGIIIFSDTVMNIQFNLSAWYLEFAMNMILFGPFVYGGMFVLAGIGVGKRKRCTRCGKVLKIKELEQMGDTFLCPYCLNDKFGGY